MVFVIPPGVESEHIISVDEVAYAGTDARVEYVGSGVVGNVSIWDVYLAPGDCQLPLNYHELSFSYEPGAWQETCAAACGEAALQERAVVCRGSDGRAYTEDWACNATLKPVSVQNCTGPCPVAEEESDDIGPFPRWVVLYLVPSAISAGFCVCFCFLCHRCYQRKSSSVAPHEEAGQTQAPRVVTAPEPPKLDAFGLPPEGRRRGKRNPEDFYGAGFRAKGQGSPTNEQ